MKPKLTIVVTTYKHPKLLYNCLASMVRNTLGPYRVIVADNSPTEEESEENRKITQNINCLRMQHMWMGGNLREALAINRAYEEVDTPFFAEINDDVVFVPGMEEFWWRLMHYAKVDHVGCVGPSSNSVSGLQDFTLFTLPDAQCTDFLNGFCLLMRTPIFREVGMFDPQFTVHMDTEFVLRVRISGYKTVIVRRSYLHHLGGGSWGRGKEVDLLIEDSVVKMVKKHGIKTISRQLPGFYQVCPWELSWDDWVDTLEKEPEILKLGDR